MRARSEAGLSRLPVTEEITGSNPAGPAMKLKYYHFYGSIFLLIEPKHKYMSESLILTTEQQEITKQRMLHDASLLIGGATIGAAGALHPTPEQVDVLRHEAPPLGNALFADDKDTENVLGPETSGMSSERLDEIIGNSIRATASKRLHLLDGASFLMGLVIDSS